jgi:hypothetical protein
MTDKAHLIKIITELKESDGWLYLRDTVIKDDILKAALDLAENKPMTPDEFNFRRGTMHAAKSFCDIPDKVIANLTNELAFDQAMIQAEDEK